jgi:hypothetical protein
MDRILTKFRQLLKSQHEDARALAGSCFQATRTLSMLLINERVPHQVVVGNVRVAGKPFYQVTPESLQWDMRQGFTSQASAAHAHTWVKLTDGNLVDATIIPTLAKRDGRRVKWNEAIIVGSGRSQWSGLPIEHVPMLEGLDYYLGAVIPQVASNTLEEMTIAFGKSWAKSLAEVNTGEQCTAR